MLDEKQKGLLRDILDSALQIGAYLKGISHDRFMANVEKQDAVLRRLEIIGEASSRVTPGTQELFPTLPFRAMRGMRNVIAHDYGEVDLDQVWNEDGLLALRARMRGLMPDRLLRFARGS
jgi:uncharacterized protein with HEPN domain